MMMKTLVGSTKNKQKEDLISPTTSSEKPPNLIIITSETLIS